MYRAKKFITFIILLFIFIFLFLGCASKYSTISAKEDVLVVHYIDVGQGDSMLIQVNGKNMLIDAGPEVNSSKLITYLTKQHIKKLDYVISTHPHEDHIGGMTKVINKFSILNFYAPKITTTTNSFKYMIDSLQHKALKIQIAKAGVTLDLGNNVHCEMLAPNSDTYKDLNNYSAVIKLDYKYTTFLFTGDAQKLSEDEIIKKGYDLTSTVLKVGHHGSRTSTSDEFLQKVNPKIAIISCGINNDFGHPHKPTLNKLQAINSRIYRTDKDGTIVLFSDGNKISKK